MKHEHAQQVPLETLGVGRGASRQVLIGASDAPNFALRRFVIEPGGGIPLHTNTVEHEQYVLRGSARLRIGDDVIHVQPDDAVFIPAGAPHDYQVTSDVPFEFVCVVPNGDDHIEMIGELADGARDC